MAVIAGDRVSAFATAPRSGSGAELSARLVNCGWVRRTAAAMQALLGTSASDWQRFADGWDDMPVDTFMADGGGYRRRRHGVFEVGPRSMKAVLGQPHYQSRAHNRLNGGVDRWFAGLSQDVTDSAVLRRILRTCREVYTPLVPRADRWRAQVHQFRIEATANAAGLPTPEGRHRDGVTAGLVMLIGRAGVKGGVTRLWTPGGDRLARFAMTNPGEALFFDDRKLLHDVSPVVAATDSAVGHRDVLVVTFEPER